MVSPNDRMPASIEKISESYFIPRDGDFPDPRAMSAATEQYVDFYHRIENWQGAQIWKSQVDLEEIKQSYYGKGAGGNPVPRGYLWLNDLEKHHRLVGAPVEEEQTSDALRALSRNIHDHYFRCEQEIERVMPGDNIKAAFKAVYVGMIFARHLYVEGSSGIGKTEIVRRMCRFLGLPYQQFDAYADATDLNLLGGEVPRTDGKGGLQFAFERGPLLSPGLLSLVIDELPRLPASTSNVLLQAMAERRVAISMVATGKGMGSVLLSPFFTVIGTGNPVGYGGQGERSLALFDRFDIGIEMDHPDLVGRLRILRNYTEGSRGISRQTNDRTKTEPNFTLYQARAAVEKVQFSPLLRPILLMASHAIGPDSFLLRTRSKDPFAEFAYILNRMSTSAEKVSEVDQRERSIWQLAPEFRQFHKSAYRQLRDLANEYLVEGSNPRGEISVLRNAQALALLNWDTDLRVSDYPFVTLTQLGQAFHWANLARLKTYPGSEAQKAVILNAACDLFFRPQNWDSVREKSKDSSALDEDWSKVMV